MVRRAADRYKNRTDLIDSYIAKVKKTKATIELVRSESALQTPSVEASLKQIVSISESLKKYLEGINVTGGPVKGFLKHLVSGDEIQGHLDKTMKDLEAAKLSLSLSIQVTNVGLVREVGEAVRVSVSTVSTMSQLIQDKLGPGCVLRMSQLIEGRASVGKTSQYYQSYTVFLLIQKWLTNKGDLSLLRRKTSRSSQRLSNLSVGRRESIHVRGASLCALSPTTRLSAPHCK